MSKDEEIIKDIKDVIKKHETVLPIEFTAYSQEAPLAPVERWLPICDAYMTAEYVGLRKEKGGATINSKIGTKVLAWVKVKIDPANPMGITVLEYCKLPD